MKCWSKSGLLGSKKQVYSNKAGLAVADVKKGIYTPVGSWMKGTVRSTYRKQAYKKSLTRTYKFKSETLGFTVKLTEI